MDKKRWLVILLLFAILIFPLVSAQSDIGGRLRHGMEDVLNWIEEIMSPIFEVLLNTSSLDEFFFAKILLFLLLFMIIITVLKKVPNIGENYGVVFIISLVVSILSIRYVPNNDFFRGMLLPYSVLGVALIVFLPFLLYFFFVHYSVLSTFGRRAAWAVYGIVFLVLWAIREYGQDSIGAANFLYMIGIALVILAFIFDKQVHKYFGLHELGRARGMHKQKLKRDILREMNQLASDWQAGLINKAQYDKEMKDLKRRYKKL